MPPKERAEVLVVAVVLVNPKESMLGGWSLRLFVLKLMVIDVIDVDVQIPGIYNLWHRVFQIFDLRNRNI